MTEYIVVDTSVARACGNEMAVDPTATSCRDALKLIEQGDWGVVVASALLAEWRSAKANRYARQWLTDMVSRRRFKAVDPSQHPGLRAQVATLPGPDQKAVQKDLFLVECAIEEGERVLSRDDAMRRILGTVARNLEEVARVHWVNPSAVDAPSWLQAGGPDSPNLKLGAP